LTRARQLAWIAVVQSHLFLFLLFLFLLFLFLLFLFLLFLFLLFLFWEQMQVCYKSISKISLSIS
jgi:hypothetical protein